jgi:uncharacterized protein (TIGR02300 family)
VAKPELGNKHQCQNCGAKFFDLNKDPIVCPKCGTVQQGAGTARQAVARAAPADEVEEDPAAAVLVPLEEADVVDDKAVAVVDDEIEIEDDTAETTFLEEEEEDADDVTGLIDGDIEDDEEV